MKSITLPKILEPTQDFPLIRLGSARDGGYLVDSRLLESDLLTFGISGDWKFEKDWKNSSRHNCRIVAYDGSIGALKFFVSAIISSFRLHKPDLVARNWGVFVDYFQFLKKHTRFKKKYVTRSNTNRTSEAFSNALLETGLTHPVFLKMDIEGDEYKLLDLILENRDLIAGIAIEFHDPLKHVEAITDFAANIYMNIANIHVNNCLPKEKDNTTEPSIEISFTDQPGDAKFSGLPHPLEQDNDPSCEPVSIRFE